MSDATYVICKNCNSSYFKEQKICPKCGMQNNTNNNLSLKLKISIFLIPIIFAWFTLKERVSPKARIISFSWMIFSIILVLSSQSEQSNHNILISSQKKSTIQNTSKHYKKLPTISSSQLVHEYSQNEIAADNNYKGHYYKINGQVESIGKDLIGDMYVTLKGSSNSFRSVQAYFDNDKVNELSKLRKGQYLIVICKIDGLMGNVLMSDCTLNH